ncbi:MAG: hypothetical protein KAI74_03300 [Kiritimatiellae bacterium]|nr:hypothetical protein [Kiritimatiellia bacterium]
MRLLRILTAALVGVTAVVWIFTTFIVRDHHIHIIRQPDSTILYAVDDGKTFDSPESCIQHCKSRRGWNLRNTVRISTDGSVNTNTLQHLGDMMCHHNIYPTTIETKSEGGTMTWEYQPSPYLEDYSRQQEYSNQ